MRCDLRYTVEDVPTPAVVIDLAAVRRNIARMAAYCGEHGLKLRPHFKTHKSVWMAQQQMAAGAMGLTVAKVGEAETIGQLAEDVLLAYPALDSHRAERLAKLTRTARVRAAVDSELAVDRLAAAAQAAGVSLGILVELDVGFRRTGVQSAQRAREIGQHVARSKGVRLNGLMFFPGHIRTAPVDQGPLLKAVEEIVQTTLAAFAKDGLPAEIVSGGSTPTAYQSHLMRGITEIRPGTYIYNDMNTMGVGYCAEADCAARVICTVVSDAVAGKIVLDGGSKMFSSDALSVLGDTLGHGWLVGMNPLRVTRLSEEHGEVDVSKSEVRPKLGQRVAVIPNHICPCINLQKEVWLKQEDGSLEPLRVDARGCVV